MRTPHSSRMHWTPRAAAVAAVVFVVVLACDEHKNAASHDAGLTEPSPNASILPAPLASGIDTPGIGRPETDAGHRDDNGRASADAGADAAPPEPRSLREDQALPDEIPRETNGLTLFARFRWLDVAAPMHAPELNADGVQRARDAVAFDVVVDLAGGRMRFVFASRAFTLPQGAELRARDDLYGHALLWPNRTTYTLLAPGALRSTLSEQRADVVPLVRAKVSALAAGSLLGLNTERIELTTPTGKLDLEQARANGQASANGTWASGVSLCHSLVELVGASPALAACRADLVPLRAEYIWPNGGHFVFEVSRLTRRNDLNPTTLGMPPAGAEFRQSELPPPPPTALLSDSELGEFRVRPTARTERADPNAPKVGLLAVNHGESLRYIGVDGAPAARLPPGTEQLLIGLRAGKYQVTARDFFGAEDAQPKTVEVPARFAIGDESEKIR